MGVGVRKLPAGDAQSLPTLFARVIPFAAFAAAHHLKLDNLQQLLLRNPDDLDLHLKTVAIESHVISAITGLLKVLLHLHYFIYNVVRGTSNDSNEFYRIIWRLITFSRSF